MVLQLSIHGVIYVICLHLPGSLVLSSYPSSSQFFNDAHRKMREPGKVYHMHDIEGRRDLVWHVHTRSFLGWEKHDRKTAGSS